MQKVTLRVRAWGMGLLAAAVLTACGGGGGGDSTPPAPVITPIPDSLAITAPPTSESATAVQFGNSAGALSGLKYQWDFGDGSSSTDAAPSHSFASGGEFEVVLKVSNEAGSSRETRTKLSITNIANVRGLECAAAANSGWCWQNPRPTGNRVNTVFFLNATTGWRGGDNGEIFKTSDAGATWTRQNTGITASIRGISFINATTGWASGAFGAMLRTTDGGNTWAVAKLPDASYSYDLAAITVIDAKTLYVGRNANSPAYYGTLFGSKDGGASWQLVTAVPYAISSTGKFWALQDNTVRLSTDGGLNYSKVLDLKLPQGGNYYYFDNTSVATGSELRAAVHTRASAYDWTTQKYNYAESFYSTVDGGANWSRVDIQGAGSWSGVQRLLSISTDGKTLIAVGNNSTLRSTDGGATWVTSYGPAPEFSPANFVSLGGSDIVASSSYSSLWLSENGGQTWMKLNNPGSQYVSGDGLRRVDANTFTATDSQGASYLSKDKGQTWTRVVAPVDNSYSQASLLAFSDAKHGFMADPNGRALTTKDGGISWQVTSTDFGVPRSVQFSSKTSGWLVGADGRLYKSTDSGQTWLTGPATSGLYYASAYFMNDTLGWAVRNGLNTVTRDGGKTWTEQNLPYGVAAIRLGEQAWVAVGGYGAVYVTTDTGSTWNAMYTGTGASLTALAFSDAKTVWAVGTDSTLLKSEDSGAKWAAVKLPGANVTLRDIKFANAKVGWIVGDAGTVLATQDGGKTWRQQLSGTGLALYTVQVVDANTAWITGANGLVLATGTGGN